jgi:hypothetical protein
VASLGAKFIAVEDDELASSPSGSEKGSSMPISTAPFFIALTIARSGRRTVSTISALPTASASLLAIFAPAAA